MDQDRKFGQRAIQFSSIIKAQTIQPDKNWDFISSSPHPLSLSLWWPVGRDFVVMGRRGEVR